MNLNKVRTIGGKIAKIRFAIGGLIVGLFLVAAGGFLTIKNINNPSTYQAVEASVTSVIGISTVDDTKYDVCITYNVDGNNYENQIMSPTSEIGSTFTIYYDVSNPNNVSTSKNDSTIIPPIILGVGVVVVGIGIFTLVKCGKEKNNDFLQQVDMSKVSQEQIDEIKNNSDPLNDYYFHFEGKMNQSYVLETVERVPIVSLKCEQFGLFKKYKYTFTNHITLQSINYEVTHAKTISYGGNGLSIPYKSTFKMNGQDVFKLIAAKGYSIISKIEGLKLNFDICHYDVPVASLESAGANVVKGGDSRLGNIPTIGVFKVKAKEQDLDVVALIAFAVSRVDFF